MVVLYTLTSARHTTAPSTDVADYSLEVLTDPTIDTSRGRTGCCGGALRCVIVVLFAVTLTTGGSLTLLLIESIVGQASRTLAVALALGALPILAGLAALSSIVQNLGALLWPGWVWPAVGGRPGPGPGADSGLS